MSTIIFLLGIGSSGKSTVANALKKQLDNSYQIVGFDYAVLELDKKYWPGGSHEKEGFYVVKVMSEHGETPELRTGAVGKTFLEKMLSDIMQLANKGTNLIIDTVLSDQEYQYLQEAFVNHKVLKIALKPPLEKVIEREDERADRRSGTAKAAYHQFYDTKTFDLIIDTEKTPPDESARLISECVNDKKKLRY